MGRRFRLWAFEGGPVAIAHGRAARQAHRRRSGVWPLLALFVVILGLIPFCAGAQTTEPLLPAPAPPIGPQAPAAPGQPIYPGQTVTQRPRPELNPIGLRIGDFFWFPHAEVDEAYNNNIFATSGPTSSDMITVLQPGFDLLSSFPRNALNLHASSALQFYTRHPTQDTEDGFAAVDGRYDVTAESWFYGRAGIAHTHEPRTSPDSPGNAAVPVTYNSYTAMAGYMQTRLRLGYQAEIAVQGQGYNAVPLIGGGILPQSNRNLTISEAVLRTGYEFLPDYQGYIRIAGNLRDYEHTVPGGVSFNSEGYRADLGLEIRPSGVAFGEIYVGYLSQVFRAPTLSPISAPDGGGRLVWNVTRLTTVGLNALRVVVESNPSITGTGTGYLASSVALTIDHELLRNLLLSVNAGYENDAFQGVIRTDHVFSAGTNVRYLLNRNFYLGGSFAHLQRASTGPSAGTPYAQSIFMLRFSSQF